MEFPAHILTLIEKIMIMILTFEIADHIRILKYKKIFTKGYAPHSSEEVFMIKKPKNTASWTYLIENFNDGDVPGAFYEKELQKINKTEFTIYKVKKKKGDKLYVKWKD